MRRWRLRRTQIVGALLLWLGRFNEGDRGQAGALKLMLVCGAEGGGRTHTRFEPHGILSCPDRRHESARKATRWHTWPLFRIALVPPETRTNRARHLVRAQNEHGSTCELRSVLSQSAKRLQRRRPFDDTIPP